MKDSDINRAFIYESGEEVNLNNNIIFSENCCEELREIDKHEIIVRICEILGPNPANLCIAEEIFDELKFEITKFVIHHEYSKKNSIRSNLLLWLDSKINPDNAVKLSKFIDKYLK